MRLLKGIISDTLYGLAILVLLFVIAVTGYGIFQLILMITWNVFFIILIVLCIAYAIGKGLDTYNRHIL